MNSDGWMEIPARLTQRRAPLTSIPKKSAATISTMEMASRISAKRLICRGEKNDTPIMTMTAGIMKTVWRSTKWKLSRPIREATAGLAAKDKRMPSPIRARQATRKKRSIVHHQLATGPRSTRLTISFLLQLA